eukprot:CAMPEP_0194270226 /NCGR_PEP_ID=MMETSP0169-20130528/4256_1 /TAXON_ID=218684 /ORGANISM="Corethron pennatum, Strain L29A3" /LENGTH=316 /DNA_ID=CAMNT_0039012193 /DNA_START=50 /DNA_END=1000 /DNA_ORIENTATION=-
MSQPSRTKYDRKITTDSAPRQRTPRGPLAATAALSILLLAIPAADASGAPPRWRWSGDATPHRPTPCFVGVIPDSTPARETRTTLHGARADRRHWLSVSASLAAGLVFSAGPASAEDVPWKKNPLTNRILEKVRILNQEAADNLDYGGTLAPGETPDTKGGALTGLLAPILAIGAEIREVDVLVHVEDGAGLREASEILSGQQFTKKGFKKTFNAYGDNIYYTDPDRANLYLGGGAPPSSEQTVAYLTRNEILTSIESLQAEVAYLLRIKNGEVKDVYETEDLFKYAKDAVRGMDKYLASIPPNEMAAVRKAVPQQ